MAESARRRRSAGCSLLADESGGSTMEFTLLLAAIAIPMLVIFRIAMLFLMDSYAMMMFLNGWPFP